MKKLVNIKRQWYIAMIVVCVCLFSFLCWLNFTKSIGLSLMRYFNNSEIEDVGQIETFNVVESADKVTPERNEAERTFIDEYNEAGSVVNTGSSEAISKKSENKMMSLVGQADKYIDLIDAKWYNAIYKKNYFSKLDSVCTYYATGEIASSQVVGGEDKWLFYKSSIDGDSIADFEGTNRFTDDEMDTILKDALWTQQQLEKRGIKFVILVAPNKENIYSEFMPDTYIHAEISSTDLLIDFLDENGVHIVSPKAELLDNHSDLQVYYPYDTHWNQLGAYIGVRNMLRFWNISMPSLSERDIHFENLSGNYHVCAVSDLANMAGLRELVFNDEVEYTVDGTGVMDWEMFAAEESNNIVSHYSNLDAKVSSSILIVGDSFRVSMVPALREMFSDVYVAHRSYYTPNILNEINPDYLICEYVERYSGVIGNIDFLVL